MAISLTNAFDAALAPYMVSCLNALGLWAKVASTFDTSESDFGPDTYTVNVDFAPQAVDTFATAVVSGDFFTSELPDLEFPNLNPIDPTPVRGIILVEGETGTDAIAAIELGTFNVDVGSTLTVRIKVKLSDKDTPEV